MYSVDSTQRYSLSYNDKLLHSFNDTEIKELGQSANI